MQLLTEKLRTALGIQRRWRRRSLPRPGALPLPGTAVVSGDLRLFVHPGMSDSLWRWLSSLGWREVSFRPDRRKYCDLPYIWVKMLYDARPDLRDHVLTDATAAARKKTPHPRAFRETHLRRQGHRLT
jgi:hypothetical protein